MEEFQQFHVGTKLKDDLADPYPREKSHPAALAKKMYTISKMELFRATFNREVVLMKRNSIVFIVKAFQVHDVFAHCNLPGQYLKKKNTCDQLFDYNGSVLSVSIMTLWYMLQSSIN